MKISISPFRVLVPVGSGRRKKTGWHWLKCAVAARATQLHYLFFRICEYAHSFCLQHSSNISLWVVLLCCLFSEECFKHMISPQVISVKITNKLEEKKGTWKWPCKTCKLVSHPHSSCCCNSQGTSVLLFSGEAEGFNFTWLLASEVYKSCSWYVVFCSFHFTLLSYNFLICSLSFLGVFCLFIFPVYFLFVLVGSFVLFYFKITFILFSFEDNLLCWLIEQLSLLLFFLWILKL